MSFEKWLTNFIRGVLIVGGFMLFLALWLGLPFWIMTQTTNGWIIAGCVAWLFLCLIGAFAAIDDGEPIPLIPPAPPRPKPPLPKPKQGRMGQ